MDGGSALGVAYVTVQADTHTPKLVPPGAMQKALRLLLLLLLLSCLIAPTSRPEDDYVEDDGRDGCLASPKLQPCSSTRRRYHTEKSRRSCVRLRACAFPFLEEKEGR